MKKIRLLTSLVELTGLSMGLVPAISSCSCNSAGLDVELVSKKKDREYNQRSSSCLYTFKLNNINTETKLKVKVVNLKVDGAEAKSVAGLLKATSDSGGNIKALINTNILVSQWPNANKITFDLEFIDKTSSKTSTLTNFNLIYNPLTLVPCFETVEWSKIIQKANEYYDGTITIEEFAKSFGDEDQNPYTTIDQYIGLEKTITINNNDHKVRVIGVNHDTLTNPTKGSNVAIFTFDLVTLLSDADGNMLKSQWFQSQYNYTYTNSNLRWNLNGNGSGSKPSQAWNDSALNMLPSELSNGIKSVTKYVATTSSFVVNTYDDKLFSLTLREMGFLYDKSKEEGKTYKYWADHNNFRDTEKLDVNGNHEYYWLVSPYTYMRFTSWRAGKNELPLNSVVTDSLGVSFAFCI